MNKSIPMASTTFGVGNEQIVLSPEEANGMLVCYNYFESVKNPANTAFLDAFHKRFGADYPNVTELAMGTYQGFKLWAEGVKKAESVDRMKVIEALETSISIDAPSGKVTIDPPTHHSVSSTFTLPRRRTKSLFCLKTSPSRSRRTPPPFATS